MRRGVEQFQWNELCVMKIEIQPIFKRITSGNSHAGVKGKRRYSSYRFSISALDGVSGQRHAPTALYPGKGS
jgi:hypothetical protein